MFSELLFRGLAPRPTSLYDIFMSFTRCDRHLIPQKLLRWYSFHKRDLPWRRTDDPYKIWISEIMLQQTQVATVIPYYQRWTRHFPTLASLARARSSEVLRYWAGLGYYRRARMLHRAAILIQKALKGKIPRTAEALRTLPGIGRYTAGAIASIAFGEKTPVLDGNVIRILTRIFGVKQSVDRPSTLDKLWELAASLLPENAPGDMNQALMELGATLCFPGNPKCPQCPVRTLCVAHKKKKESFFPVRSKKERYEKIKMAALVLQDDKGKVWIEKQREHDRWGGLWMFPFWESKKGMFKEIGKDLRRRTTLLLTLRHAYTRYRITLEVYKAQIPERDGRFRSLKRRHGRWVSVRKTGSLAFPAPHRRIAASLLAENL